MKAELHISNNSKLPSWLHYFTITLPKNIYQLLKFSSNNIFYIIHQFISKPKQSI